MVVAARTWKRSAAICHRHKLLLLGQGRRHPGNELGRSDLEQHRKGAAQRLKLLALAAANNDDTGWIAQRLQMGTKTHLSHLLYWDERGKSNKLNDPELRNADNRQQQHPVRLLLGICKTGCTLPVFVHEKLEATHAPNGKMRSSGASAVSASTGPDLSDEVRNFSG